MKCEQCDGTGKIYQDNIGYESYMVCRSCNGTGNYTDNIIIYKIQEIREKNNKAWMDILRLAFKAAPEQAKEIFSKITENDRKINELSKELCG